MVYSLASATLTRIRPISVTVEEPKTVAQLLSELKISDEHIVLVNGKRATLDLQITESDSVVILPLIVGG
jgi:sulfur carrier protein ThiS